MRNENERLAGGPARSFVELYQSSFAMVVSRGSRCATLGFVAERLRRVHAAYTEQHGTTFSRLISVFCHPPVLVNA